MLPIVTPIFSPGSSLCFLDVSLFFLGVFTENAVCSPWKCHMSQSLEVSNVFPGSVIHMFSLGSLICSLWESRMFALGSLVCSL